MSAEIYYANEAIVRLFLEAFLFSSLASIIVFILTMSVALRIVLSRFSQTSEISEIVKPIISVNTLNWSVDYEKAEEIVSKSASKFSTNAFLLSGISGFMAHWYFYNTDKFLEVLNILGNSGKDQLEIFATISIPVSLLLLLISARIYSPGNRYRKAIRTKIVKRTSFASSSLEELSTLETLIRECRDLARNLKANVNLLYCEEVKDFIHKETPCIFRGPEILELFIDERILLANKHMKELQSLNLEFNTTVQLYKKFTLEASSSGRRSMQDIADDIGEGLGSEQIIELVEAQKYDDLHKILNTMREQLTHLLATVQRNINHDNNGNRNYYDLLELKQSASEDEIRIKLKEKKRSWTQRQNAPKIEQRQQASMNLSIVPEIEENLLDPLKREAYDRQL